MKRILLNVAILAISIWLASLITGSAAGQRIVINVLFYLVLVGMAKLHQQMVREGRK